MEYFLPSIQTIQNENTQMQRHQFVWTKKNLLKTGSGNQRDIEINEKKLAPGNYKQFDIGDGFSGRRIKYEGDGRNIYNL